jgi:hypothetical protein
MKGAGLGSKYLEEAGKTVETVTCSFWWVAHFSSEQDYMLVIKNYEGAPSFDFAQDRFSRVLCEKWGFPCSSVTDISEILTYDS